MFMPMRRKERELPRSEAERILHNGSYGILSMCGDNGFGYGVPLGYVYNGNYIYFHWAVAGQKLSCIRSNNKVSFCVVEKANVLPEQFSMQYASAIAYGKVSEVDDAEKITALMAFVEKYSPDYVDKGREYAANSLHRTIVIKMTIEHLTGKARP